MIDLSVLQGIDKTIVKDIILFFIDEMYKSILPKLDIAITNHDIEIQLTEIKTGLNNDNWELIHDASHSLKGSCAQLGIYKFAEVMKKINIIAKKKSGNIDELLKRTDDLFDKLKYIRTTM